jgi:excisionase family DNA binding protein
MHDDSQLLKTKEAAELLGLKAVTLRIWRMKGTGPDFYRVNGRAIRYRRSDLEAFARRNYVEVEKGV